jgi:hypothetical protein
MPRTRLPAPAFAAVVACAWLAVAGAAPPPGPAGPPGLQRPERSPHALPDPPVVGEYRYRMWAGIRPLLVFWIGRDNVGGGRIVLRRDEAGARGFELLIGSDPRRAPTGINRWGYIREVAWRDGAELLGVMKRSDEQSLDEAKAKVANEKGGYYFKRIDSVNAAGETKSTVSLARFEQDFTYRDLAGLLGLMGAGAQASATREMPVPAGARSGFLVAAADLLHADVEAYRQSNWQLRRRGPVRVTHVYNARLYDLVLVSSRLVKRRRVSGRTYDRAIEADFTSGQHGTSDPDHFSLVYGTDGRYAEIPLVITYQPRWWFKAELVLDERETF